MPIFEVHIKRTRIVTNEGTLTVAAINEEDAKHKANEMMRRGDIDEDCYSELATDDEKIDFITKHPKLDDNDVDVDDLDYIMTDNYRKWCENGLLDKGRYRRTYSVTTIGGDTIDNVTVSYLHPNTPSPAPALTPTDALRASCGLPLLEVVHG